MNPVLTPFHRKPVLFIKTSEVKSAHLFYDADRIPFVELDPATPIHDKSSILTSTEYCINGPHGAQVLQVGELPVRTAYRDGPRVYPTCQFGTEKEWMRENFPHLKEVLLLGVEWEYRNLCWMGDDTLRTVWFDWATKRSEIVPSNIEVPQWAKLLWCEVNNLP